MVEFRQRKCGFVSKGPSEEGGAAMNFKILIVEDDTVIQTQLKKYANHFRDEQQYRYG